ncbi:MAG: glycosyltransferase family 2 protein [Prolixibacteraceae bacterium]
MVKVIKKDNQPLVTIITVVLNGEKTIGRTIRSVLGQSYLHLEYIVLDGGSTDGTISIIRKYENDGRLSWLSEPDGGIADAWNKGIGMASGELIGLINADDWYEEDALEKILRRRSNVPSVLCGNVRLWNSPGKFNTKKSSIKGIRSQMTIWHPGMFCPREVYTRIGLYDTHLKIVMDYDFVVRCYLKGVPFEIIDDDIANMSFGGVSNRLISKSMKESLDIKNKYFGIRPRHFFEYAFFQAYFHAIILLKRVVYA